MSLSDSIIVILVQTQVSGNIGAVARAMMNNGADKLRLVNPTAHHLNRECLDRSMTADSIVREAQVYQTLKEATKDCHLIVGTSGKKRSGRVEWKTPREFAEIFLADLGKKVALVFGQEDRGLDSDDLALCDLLIEIPTSEKFPSLNLSHAVMIILYELFLQSNVGAALCGRPQLGQPHRLAPTADPPATAEQKEAFYEQFEKALWALKVLETKSSDRMLRTFRSLFGRANLDEYEVGLLRGMCRKILEKIF